MSEKPGLAIVLAAAKKKQPLEDHEAAEASPRGMDDEAGDDSDVSPEHMKASRHMREAHEDGDDAGHARALLAFLEHWRANGSKADDEDEESTGPFERD